MRQVVLDTETTGLSPTQGHRIIEIGCVELNNRRITGKEFHVYINPLREVDRGAINVHGITNEFLEDKPKFHEISQEFQEFIDGAELVIHNAPFDVKFIEHEFSLLKLKTWSNLDNHCEILDTLTMARKMHPGQRNNLDALCKRYKVNNTHRDKHGALLDAQILADLYLVMTGGQDSLEFEAPVEAKKKTVAQKSKPLLDYDLVVIEPTSAELAAHEKFIERF